VAYRDTGVAGTNVPVVQAGGKLHPSIIPDPPVQIIRKRLLLDTLEKHIAGTVGSQILGSWPNDFSVIDEIDADASSEYVHDAVEDTVSTSRLTVLDDLTDLAFTGSALITVSATSVTGSAPNSNNEGTKYSTIPLSGEVRITWNQNHTLMATPQIFPADNVAGAAANTTSAPRTTFGAAAGAWWPTMVDNSGDLQMILYRSGSGTTYNFPEIPWVANGITFTMVRAADGVTSVWADDTLLISETTFDEDLLFAFSSYDHIAEDIRDIEVSYSVTPQAMALQWLPKTVASSPDFGAILCLVEQGSLYEQLSRNLGTAIGSAGTPSDAFDGDVDKTNAEAARNGSGKTVTVGKDWGASYTKEVTRVVVTGPSDGFGSSADGDVTIEVYATTDGTASGGTLVGSDTVTDGSSLEVTIDIGSPEDSRSIYISVTHDGTNNDCGIAHVDFYLDDTSGGEIDYDTEVAFTLSRDGGVTDVSLTAELLGVSEDGHDIVYASGEFTGDAGTEIVPVISTTGGRMVTLHAAIPYVE
jgi:hypothetical protein